MARSLRGKLSLSPFRGVNEIPFLCVLFSLWTIPSKAYEWGSCSDTSLFCLEKLFEKGSGFCLEKREKLLML